MKVAWLLGILIFVYIIFSYVSEVSASIQNNVNMLDLLRWVYQSSEGDAELKRAITEQYPLTLDNSASIWRKDSCDTNATTDQNVLAPMSCAIRYAYLPGSVRPSYSDTADPMFVFLVARGDRRKGDFALAIEGLTLLENSYGQSFLLRQEKIDALMGMALDRIAEADLIGAQSYLQEMDQLGNDNEWNFFQLYKALSAGGFEDEAIEYLSRSKYFRLDNNLSDYIHTIIPELIRNSLVDLKELELIHAYLSWQGRNEDATDLMNLIDVTFISRPEENTVDQIGSLSHAGVNELIHLVAEILEVAPENVALGENKITNGSFESWNVSGIPQDWSWSATTGDLFDRALVVGGADSKTVYDGVYSARIMRLWQMNIAGKAPFRAGFSTQIRPDSSAKYHVLSFAYKTDKINAPGVAILFDCFNGIASGDYQFLPDTKGKWRTGILIGSLKEPCTQLASLFFANFGVGEVWFDVVSFASIQIGDSVIESPLSHPKIEIR